MISLVKVVPQLIVFISVLEYRENWKIIFSFLLYVPVKCLDRDDADDLHLE